MIITRIIILISFISSHVTSLGFDEVQELSDDVNSCIDFVNNTQWIQREGNNLMDSIISQIDQYISELEESINYDKR